MDPMQQAAVQSLFDDWVRNEIALTWELSSSINDDVLKLHNAARERAAVLGIEFDDAPFADYMPETES